ncbi:HAD-IB family phosphatase [Komagataeibacter sp. FNDCR2]|uniref:HAD-IB family phosphatase n=1 Tax=Komagataeibacter sp. FNDCR2 TaxID=2878682 RepID=UPI001E4EE340|nr:HAD-IB family phosphatase [Komagataeibacter sp. FNDCR2]MCE2574089.1 HAD-IB family phosphatase [Komagataeibacter sp. FNDCR2]
MTHKTVTHFLFDLDGTVVDTELLPLIAQEIGLEIEMAELVRKSMAGLIPFETSFRQRVDLLSEVSIARVREIVATAPINPVIASFIREHADQCTIVTGNCDCWIEELIARLGCAAISSRASEGSDGRLLLHHVNDKGQAVKKFSGRVIAIGDGANDVGMFQEATYGIAYGSVHPPAPVLLEVATHAVYQADSLCSLLSRFL